MRKIFELSFFLLVLTIFSIAFQQYAGTVYLNVFNGSSATTNYRWLLNDEAQAINVTIYTGCETSGACDFVKYVKVTPETMIVPPRKEGFVDVTATIPKDYNFSQGNLTGYMYARLEGGETGQVTIRLQMGKLVKVSVYRNVTLRPEINETLANATAPTQMQLPDVTPFVIALIVLAVVAVAAWLLKGLGKKAPPSRPQKQEKFPAQPKEKKQAK